MPLACRLCGRLLEVTLDDQLFVSFPIALPHRPKACVSFFNVVFLLARPTRGCSVHANNNPDDSTSATSSSSASSSSFSHKHRHSETKNSVKNEGSEYIAGLAGYRLIAEQLARSLEYEELRDR